MTKADIVDKVAAGTGLTKLETEAIVEGFLKTVIEALKEGQRDYGTAVHGIVYKLYSPASNVIVKLYKGETLLDQDTTDDYGYYEICVCCQHQGTGTYTVLARKDYKGQIWVDTESFYWDIETGPFDFEIDLHLNLTK